MSGRQNLNRGRHRGRSSWFYVIPHFDSRVAAACSVICWPEDQADGSPDQPESTGRFRLESRPRGVGGRSSSTKFCVCFGWCHPLAALAGVHLLLVVVAG